MSSKEIVAILNEQEQYVVCILISFMNLIRDEDKNKVLESDSFIVEYNTVRLAEYIVQFLDVLKYKKATFFYLFDCKSENELQVDTTHTFKSIDEIRKLEFSNKVYQHEFSKNIKIILQNYTHLININKTPKKQQSSSTKNPWFNKSP
ncbi:hypothetical protein ACLBXI_20700 [Bacillus cereus]